MLKKILNLSLACLTFVALASESAKAQEKSPKIMAQLMAEYQELGGSLVREYKRTIVKVSPKLSEEEKALLHKKLTFKYEVLKKRDVYRKYCEAGSDGATFLELRSAYALEKIRERIRRIFLKLQEDRGNVGRLTRKRRRLEKVRRETIPALLSKAQQRCEKARDIISYNLKSLHKALIKLEKK